MKKARPLPAALFFALRLAGVGTILAFRTLDPPDRRIAQALGAGMSSAIGTRWTWTSRMPCSCAWLVRRADILHPEGDRAGQKGAGGDRSPQKIAYLCTVC